MKKVKIAIAIVGLLALGLTSCKVHKGCEAYGKADVAKKEVRG